MAGETCSTCGTARKGSFRYCLSCGYDYEPRPDAPPATQWPIRTSPGAISEEVAAPEEAIGVTDQVACPYLGLVDDAETHFMFATPGHRCRAERVPARISLPHQGQFCLSSDYRACPIYAATDQPVAGSHSKPRPAPSRGPLASAPRLRSFGPFVLAALLVVAAAWVIGSQRQGPAPVEGAPVETPSQPAGSPSPTLEAP